MTLEVRNDNHIARQLYRDFGFASGSDDSSAYAFWTKYLTTDAAAPAP
jgi:hypothetical protein